MAPAADESRAEALSRPRAIALGVVGLTLGASAAFSGFYDTSDWRIAALVLLTVLVTLVVIAPALPRGPALAALAGLSFLALWSLLSGNWGESSEQALQDAHRWLLYALLLGVLLLLLDHDRRSGAVLLGAATAGVLAIGAYDLAEMLAGDGPSLFVLSRLNEPLGYTNGQGTYFVLAIWPLVAVAERNRWSIAKGLALAAASALAALAVMSQSRGALVAFGVSAVGLLALAPGRKRRAWALLTILGGVLLASAAGMDDLLSAASSDELAPSAETVRRGALGALFGAGVAGSVWALGCWLTGLFGVSRVDRLRMSILSAAGLATVSVLGVIAVFTLANDPIGKVGDQFDAFRKLETSTAGQSRLVSGSGNRYDYWRIALRGFTAQPLAGEGAGSFGPRYFRERETTDDIRQPHSLELQTLADTGLVGGAGLALALGAMLLAFWRRLRTETDPRLAAVSLAAAGVFLAWLVQTSVDWLHLIPGLTGIALCGAAIVLAPSLTSAEAPGYRTRILVLVACLAAVVVLAASLGKSVVAGDRREEARAQIATNPAEAIDLANDSLALDRDSLETYYAKAAAYARLDRYADARATLLEAARLEPREFVTWGLLGDLAIRRGNLDAAEIAYARASRLSPRDAALARLAGDRALLKRLSRDPDLLRVLSPARITSRQRP